MQHTSFWFQMFLNAEGIKQCHFNHEDLEVMRTMREFCVTHVN